jgi:virginiamycin B lyase
MRERQCVPQPEQMNNEVKMAQRIRSVVAHGQGRRSSWLAYHQGRYWFVLGILLLGVVTLVAISYEGIVRSGQASMTHGIPSPVIIAAGAFHEYPLPRADSEVMRPAIDQQGRIWFGAMGQNALVAFDPRTRSFQYLTPPHGHHGIMGVQAAHDNTIWFAEQFANYIGHYFPVTGRYKIYPLPRLTIPDPSHAGRTIALTIAPNELALDAHNNVWFTELNADRLGKLDPRSEHMWHYPLSSKTSVQTLLPYGVTVDPQGKVWFTEAGSNRLGRLDPATGALHLFTVPQSHTLLMEIASDAHGIIWVTSFTPGLLLRFTPGSGTFTNYTTPFTKGSESSALYGLLVTSAGDVWVTILAENVIARLDVAANRFIYYRIPTRGSLPLGLVMDANHNFWFTCVDNIGLLQLEKNG